MVTLEHLILRNGAGTEDWINNPGLTNPVMIISAQYVELESCE